MTTERVNDVQTFRSFLDGRLARGEERITLWIVYVLRQSKDDKCQMIEQRRQTPGSLENDN